MTSPILGRSQIQVTTWSSAYDNSIALNEKHLSLYVSIFKGEIPIIGQIVKAKMYLQNSIFEDHIEFELLDDGKGGKNHNYNFNFEHFHKLFHINCKQFLVNIFPKILSFHSLVSVNTFGGYIIGVKLHMSESSYERKFIGAKVYRSESL